MTDQTNAIVCGTREAGCICVLAPEHDGPHECDCGGRWTFDETGNFVAVRWPQRFMEGPLTGEQTPFADDSVDAPLLTLWHLLGGRDD